MRIVLITLLCQSYQSFSDASQSYQCFYTLYPNTTTYGLYQRVKVHLCLLWPLCDPFLLWLTTHTKEPQWPLVKGVLGHPLATAGADRVKVSGSGVREMPHARSSVTQLGPLGWHWLAFRADTSPPYSPPLAYGRDSFRLSVPPMRMASDSGMIHAEQSVQMRSVCIAAQPKARTHNVLWLLYTVL